MSRSQKTLSANILHLPYLLTKWLGEELAMAYHFQYGVPTTVMRFSTVIEPSEFLNERRTAAALPLQYCLLKPTRTVNRVEINQSEIQWRILM